MKKLILIFTLLVICCSVYGQSEEANTVSGFRVCVFNGTQQNARQLANQAVEEVRKNVSSTITIKMSYQAPVFKVLVGACINRTEATILLAKLRKLFPTANVVNDKIKVEEFKGTPSMMDETKDITQTEESNTEDAII